MEMKKLLGIVMLLVGSVNFVYGQQQGNNAGDLLIVSQSRYDYATTLERFTEQILARGWKVTIVHDLQLTLKKSGIDEAPIKVIEVCNPRYSAQLLSVDSLRIYSPLMPCRLSVYQTSDGKTYISRMNVEKMSSQMDRVARDVMEKAFGEMEESLKVIVVEK